MVLSCFIVRCTLYIHVTVLLECQNVHAFSVRYLDEHLGAFQTPTKIVSAICYSLRRQAPEMLICEIAPTFINAITHNIFNVEKLIFEYSSKSCCKFFENIYIRNQRFSKIVSSSILFLKIDGIRVFCMFGMHFPWRRYLVIYWFVFL